MDNERLTYVRIEEMRQRAVWVNDHETESICAELLEARTEIESAHTRIAELEEQLRGVPVGERLPEDANEHEVLVNGKTRRAWYSDFHKEWLSYGKPVAVTHWRETPLMRIEDEGEVDA